MAPIRRYLRITKHSVLECRIYLDNPALAQSWLLHPRDPVLPRVIASVRPLVLPKLREEKERERSRKKGKKRSIKDVVVEDDFEVSIFLTETDTRHSLLHKQKLFRDKVQTRLTSNSSRLVGASREAPIDVEGQFVPTEKGTAELAVDVDIDDVPILREEGDGDHDIINLNDIPEIDQEKHEDETTAEPEPTNRRRSKRRRSGTTGSDAEVIDSDAGDSEPFVDSSGNESASDDDDDDDDEAGGPPPPKRRRRGRQGEDEETAAAGDTTAAAGTGHDDKKKMAMDILYEGFAIYGRVLCLVVKRRGDGRGGGGVSSAAGPSGRGNLPQAEGGRPGGQAMMENWIASTQLPEADADADAGDAADPL